MSEEKYIEVCGTLLTKEEYDKLVSTNKKIKKLRLNNSDVWTGKTDTDLIVDKINEIIDFINKEDEEE